MKISSQNFKQPFIALWEIWAYQKCGEIKQLFSQWCPRTAIAWRRIERLTLPEHKQQSLRKCALLSLCITHYKINLLKILLKYFHYSESYNQNMDDSNWEIMMKLLTSVQCMHWTSLTAYVLWNHCILHKLKIAYWKFWDNIFMILKVLMEKPCLSSSEVICICD